MMRISPRMILLIPALTLVLAACGTGKGKEEPSAETADPEGQEVSEEDAAREQDPETLRDQDIYLAIAEELLRQYGKCRVRPFQDEIRDQNRSAREVNGICYLRLLDFDNDGDNELYAVCKTEQEEDYTGLVYSAEGGRDPIFRESVDSELWYSSHTIDLVRRGREEALFYIYTGCFCDGRGGEDTETLYGYDPDDPESFSCLAFFSSEELEREDGTWHTVYRVRDSSMNGEWTAWDEEETFRELRASWWEGAESEVSLCVKSYRGEIDADQLAAAIRDTVLALGGDPDAYTDTFPESFDTDDHNAEAAEDPEAEAPGPFYGIWFGASRDEEDARRMAEEAREKGLSAQVFVTTDWENLNTETWYAVTAGTYGSPEEAEESLSRVRQYYPDAYIKYSGDRRR